MTWKFDPKLPVSVQITGKLRTEIINGTYPPGSQFPTVRQLAFEASVNPNTMQKALTALETEGLLISRGTVGRFVTGDGALLEQARRDLQLAYMERVLEEAQEMGISSSMFAEFIKEREVCR